jgi:hypothetical protein
MPATPGSRSSSSSLIEAKEDVMKKRVVLALACVSVFGLAVPALAGDDDSQGDNNHQGENHHRDRPSHKILQFQNLYGVDGPFLGEANAIRGVEGDEAPWVIRSARGWLSDSGRLKIQVRGLVFADDPLSPPDLIGKNDETEFRGLVSCLTEVGDSVQEANVVTKGFKANERGDSNIDDRVDLPDPCVAPIVFVLAGSEDKWFAVTGFESPEDESGDDEQ